MKTIQEDAMKTRVSMIIIAVCLAAMAGLSACKSSTPGAKKADALPDAIKISVSVAKAQRRTLIQERKILATLEAYRETDLGPLSPGRVKSLSVQIGDNVEAGQVVAKMDDAQLVATEAQFASLKSQYERSLSLYRNDALPKAQFEGVEAQYTALKRQLESLRENTTLTAPFAGVVTARACEEGELYSPAMGGMKGQSKGLIRITQLNPLKMDLDIDDQTIPYVRKGMTVRFTVDQPADTSELFGKVEWVNPQASAASQTFAVRVVVQNAKRVLRPGYFAEVRIAIDQKAKALCVPREALVDDQVFIVNNNIATVKKVTTGWLTRDYAEILSGLEENTIVVVKGNKALPDSAEVRIVE